MATWGWTLASAYGGELLSLTEATNRAVTFKLTEPSTASFDIAGRGGLDGKSGQASQIRELATDLIVTRDGVRLYRGRIGPTTDTLDALSHKVSVSTLDYRELLNRRQLYAEDQLTYGNADQGAIVWGLIQSTQARTGGDLGIVQGAGAVSGILRERRYAAGDVIGANIAELAELLDGFDWDITPVDGTLVRLDLWHGTAGRGTNRGVVLEYGGLVTGVNRSVPVDSYANAVRVTGNGNSALAEVREASDLADRNARPEGRWDGLYGFPDVPTQSQLAERAAWQIADSQVIRPTYTLTMKVGGWSGPSHIWLGDTVQVRVNSGRLTVDVPMRVYEINVTPGELLGVETVTLTVGGPRPDYRRRSTDIMRRLRDLERR